MDSEKLEQLNNDLAVELNQIIDEYRTDHGDGFAPFDGLLKVVMGQICSEAFDRGFECCDKHFSQQVMEIVVGTSDYFISNLRNNQRRMIGVAGEAVMKAKKGDFDQ